MGLIDVKGTGLSSQLAEPKIKNQEEEHKKAGSDQVKIDALRIHFILIPSEANKRTNFGAAVDMGGVFPTAPEF